MKLKITTLLLLLVKILSAQNTDIVGADFIMDGDFLTSTNVLVGVYSTDNPIDSIQFSWGDGNTETFQRRGWVVFPNTNVVWSLFDGVHTYADTGIYVPQVYIGFLKDDFVNIDTPTTTFLSIRDTFLVHNTTFIGVNSAPVYMTNHVTVQYNNDTISHNVSITDLEGDSISHELVPFQVAGYSYPDADTLYVLSDRGALFVVGITEPGRYAFGIKSTERRLGTLLQTMTRHLSIYVDSTMVSNTVTVNVLEPLQVFPNPAAEYISLPTKNLNGNFIVSVYNISGQRVLETNVNNLENSIPIHTLISGVYYLIIQTKGKLYTSKFIKQ